MQSQPSHRPPCRTPIHRNIRPRRPHRHQPLPHHGHHRSQPTHPCPQFPSHPPILRHRHIPHSPVFQLVVPPNNNPMPPIPEHYRKNPRARPRLKPHISNRPSPPSVRTPQHPPRRSPHPQILLPPRSNIRPTSRKRSLPRQRPRHLPPLPMRPPIRRKQKHKLTPNRIPHRHPMPRIPKRHRVIKRLLIGILKLQRPRHPRIPRLINPRRSPRPNAQHIRRLLIHRVHIPEVQLLRSRHNQPLPSRPPIRRPQHRPLRPARPRHPLVHRAHPAQPRRNPANQYRPLLPKPSQAQPQNQ